MRKVTFTFDGVDDDDLNSLLNNVLTEVMIFVKEKRVNFSIKGDPYSVTTKIKIEGLIDKERDIDEHLEQEMTKINQLLDEKIREREL